MSCCRTCPGTERWTPTRGSSDRARVGPGPHQNRGHTSASVIMPGRPVPVCTSVQVCGSGSARVVDVPPTSTSSVLPFDAVTTDVALAGLQAATAQFGNGSVEWASALCDLGNALLATGQPDRAADCYRQAASVKPRDDESRKDRLTY